MRRLPLLLVAFALTPSSSAATPPACKLLTPTQVRHALGVAIQQRKSDDRGTCTWLGVPWSASSPAQAQLTLGVQRVPTRARFEKLSRTIPPPLVARGIGDAAYRGTDGSFLYVWQHGWMVSVEAYVVVHPLDTEKHVARLVLPQLAMKARGS